MNGTASTEILNAIRTREPLPHTLISLKKLIGCTDLAPGYLQMVSDALADNEMLDGEDIQINFCDFPDILMSPSGLLMAKPILKNYISNETLSAVYRLAQDEEKVRYAVSNVAEILKNMTWSQLLKAYATCEAEQRLFYRQEMIERFPVSVCIRKARSAAQEMRVRWKYRSTYAAVKAAVKSLSAEQD